MWKRRGVDTSNLDLGASLGLGDLKNIWKRSRCSSIWTKRRSAGTEKFCWKDDAHGNDTNSNGNSGAKIESFDGAAERGRGARALSFDADFYGESRRRDD